MKNRQMSSVVARQENPAPQAQLLTVPARKGYIGANSPQADPGRGEAAKSNATLRFAPAVLEEFVEAEDAAPFMHKSPRHLMQLAREGKVPAHPQGEGQRRRWLFLLSELDAWMRSHVNSACDPCRA